MKRCILVVLAFTALSGAAFAQADGFKSLDGNGDGNLSMGEAQSRFPNLTLQMYTNADGNSDNQLNQDEFNSVLQVYNKAKADGLIQ